MVQRIFQTAQSLSTDTTLGEEVITPAVQPAGIAIDELLDNIDLVIEDNASEFVQGFVQKGGE